ncbi:MAG: cobyrinate a,c-diamide synthase [Pseudomonadota bacterium]
MKATLIAAPSSGAGKTTVTLALLRALAQDGHAPRSVKLGPDYIDPAFHSAATGCHTLNLDPWAMDADMQAAMLAGNGPLVVESAMGLFDGAGLSGAGSAADVAERFGLPITLVVDCAKAAQTIPALVEGITRHRPGLRFHGLVLNRVGSARHEAILREALKRSDTPPVLAVLRREDGLTLPSRHLGLVQAAEHPDLPQKLDAMAEWLRRAVDPRTLLATSDAPAGASPQIPPPGKRIAIAKDEAFSFIYPHFLTSWVNAGAQIAEFSPLADEAVPEADFVFLPGGYPELHAGRLARARTFIKSLRNASQNITIYGECGGYMTLGETLIDGDGAAHAMAGLLPVTTSFATPKLTLGHRALRAEGGPWPGANNLVWRGHEFHFSTAVEERGTPLFTARDADGAALPAMGLRSGNVSGSYAHLIAPHRPETP